MSTNYDIDHEAEYAKEDKALLLAVCKAVAACPQAAPWLARLPFKDGTVYDALLAAIDQADSR